MKKLIILILVASGILPGANQFIANSHTSKPIAEHKPDDAYTINVKLDKTYQGKVYLATMTTRLTRIDSIEVNGNTFTFSGVLKHTDIFRVLAARRDFDFSVCLEPGGTYEIQQQGKFYSVSTDNGPEQTKLDEFHRRIKPKEQKIDDYGQQYTRLIQAGNTQAADSITTLLHDEWTQLNNEKINFIEQNREGFAAVVVASELLSRDYPDFVRAYKAIQHTNFKDTYAYRAFIAQYEALGQQWIENNKAPDFITKDIKGKTVRLSDFKGKYLLLDFWASWCHPCRTKMKELKAIYPELQKKGIEVCSINLDEKKESWLKASKEDNLIWTNTADIVPFKKNQIAKAYRVNVIPALFLITPQGTILMQNPTLKQILELK